jgi:hypothetical protein
VWNDQVTRNPPAHGARVGDVVHRDAFTAFHAGPAEFQRSIAVVVVETKQLRKRRREEKGERDGKTRLPITASWYHEAAPLTSGGVLVH